MGRLEDIVERNRRTSHNRERTMAGVGLGLFVLLILGLMVFTNLGERPEASEPIVNPAPDPGPRERRLDGVPLRSAPARKSTP